MSGFKSFLRGFFFDPELEKKAHKLADEAQKTVESANEILGKTKKILNNAGDVKELVVIAGIGILAAGFIAGSLSKIKWDNL